MKFLTPAIVECADAPKSRLKIHYTFYNLLSFFFLYAFLGWSCEVVYAYFRAGTFINRGFLFGPLCPIYGFGVVSVLIILEKFRDRPFFVFLLSVLITTMLELIVGIAANAFFHVRLWDYSYMPMNLRGYICPTFSLLWGLGCLGIFYGVHPLLYRLIEKIPHTFGVVLLCIFSVLIVCDFSYTVWLTVTTQPQVCILFKNPLSILPIPA